MAISATDVIANQSSWYVETGDALDMLRSLPTESVHLIFTSPPYYHLRDNDVPAIELDGNPSCEHVWSRKRIKGITGGLNHAKNGQDKSIVPDTIEETCDLCGRWRGEIGRESTPELYAEHMGMIFEEARRVLRSDGTLYLNLGDSYSGSGKGPTGRSSIMGKSDQEARQGGKSTGAFTPPGYKPKDMFGIPYLVSEALRKKGWWRRSEIIWYMRNRISESVLDRPIKTHETIWLLSKSPTYYYDWYNGRRFDAGGTGANLRTVWDIPIKKRAGSRHTSTFPVELAEQVIKLGTSDAGCCPECLMPYERYVYRHARGVFTSEGWGPICNHKAVVSHQDLIPALVLDPFAGSGTTGEAARRLGRRFLGSELNEEHAEYARQNVGESLPLLDVLETGGF